MCLTKINKKLFFLQFFQMYRLPLECPARVKTVSNLNILISYKNPFAINLYMNMYVL